MMHLNGISTIPNPFETLSYTFVVKGVEIATNSPISKRIEGDTFFFKGGEPGRFFFNKSLQFYEWPITTLDFPKF